MAGMKFTATIQQEGKTATGIPVPPEVVEALGAGKKPPVTVTLGDHTYRSTIAVRGDQFLIALSAENRTKVGVAGGDTVEVDIALDEAPREVVVPDDLAAALATDATATADPTPDPEPKRANLFEPAIVRRAAGDAVRKLDPRQMARNPVMFIVELGSVVVTLLFLRDLPKEGEPHLFTGLVAAWLDTYNSSPKSLPAQVSGAVVQHSLQHCVAEASTSAPRSARAAGQRSRHHPPRATSNPRRAHDASRTRTARGRGRPRWPCAAEARPPRTCSG